MPTYDYQCQACGHDFSAMHKISDDAPSCPQCGGAVRKKLSAPAIRGSQSASNLAKAAPAMPTGGCGAGCGCHRPQ